MTTSPPNWFSEGGAPAPTTPVKKKPKKVKPTSYWNTGYGNHSLINMNTWVIDDNGGGLSMGAPPQAPTPIPPPPTHTEMSPGEKLFVLRQQHAHKLNKIPPNPHVTWGMIGVQNKGDWEAYANQSIGQWEIWCYENNRYDVDITDWKQMMGITNSPGEFTFSVRPTKPTRAVRCINRPGETYVV